MHSYRPGPVKTDKAGAQRVVQGAQQMMRQLRSATVAAAAAAAAGDATAADETVDESAGDEDEADDSEGDAWSSVDSTDTTDAPPPPAAAVSRSGGGGGGGQSPQDFARAWQAQAARRGLAGALVALAYPDRIAQRKDGGGSGGGRASFVLASGALPVLQMRSSCFGFVQVAMPVPDPLLHTHMDICTKPTPKQVAPCACLMATTP